MKRKIFTFLTVLVITAALTVPLQVSARTPAQSGTMSQLEQDAAALINRQRASFGLESLTISSELSASARVKARDMEMNSYFSHTSPTYGSPFAMMKALGVSYLSAAENIAIGYRTAEAVVSAWMASSSHRANILSDQYTEMGIGYTGGYWTLWLIR